jgi:hypothetical protein
MGDDPNKPFVMPGEIISQEQREKLGANRLRRWFENGTLALADFVAPEPQRRLALQNRGELVEEAPVAVLEPEEPNVPAEEVWDQIEKDRAERERLERNAKAREKRAAAKKAEAKRLERNRKARERRAAKKAEAARVNGGE